MKWKLEDWVKPEYTGCLGKSTLHRNFVPVFCSFTDKHTVFFLHFLIVNLFVIRSEREVKDLKEKFLRGKGTPNLVSNWILKVSQSFSWIPHKYTDTPALVLEWFLSSKYSVWWMNRTPSLCCFSWPLNTHVCILEFLFAVARRRHPCGMWVCKGLPAWT